MNARTQALALVAVGALLVGCGTQQPEGSESARRKPEVGASGESRYAIPADAKCPESFADPVDTVLEEGKTRTWAGGLSTILPGEPSKLVDIVTGDTIRELTKSENDPAPVERAYAIGVGGGYTVSYIGSDGAGLDAKDVWVTVRLSNDGTELWRKSDLALDVSDVLGTPTAADPDNPEPGARLDDKIGEPYFDPTTADPVPAEVSNALNAGKGMRYQDDINSPYAVTVNFDKVETTNRATGAKGVRTIQGASIPKACGDWVYLLKDSSLYVLDAATLDQVSVTPVDPMLEDVNTVRPGGVLLQGGGSVVMLPGKAGV